MNFESYAKRIVTQREPDYGRNKKQIVRKRLQVTNTKMKMTSLNKVQFAGLNNKRYYFLDGIVSLSYGNPLLSKICQIKKAYPKIHKVIEQEKNNLLKLENQAHERLRILRSIYAQPITYYKLENIGHTCSFCFFACLFICSLNLRYIHKLPHTIPKQSNVYLGLIDKDQYLRLFCFNKVTAFYDST